MKVDLGERVLEYGRRRVPYQLSTSKRKKLRITVEPDLTVRVDAPTGSEESEITKAIESRPYRFASGETFLYLGRQYRLRVNQG